jgi:hypothetical protein
MQRQPDNADISNRHSIKMKTRGRRTLLCAKLQKQICGYLSDCCTIRTACEATGFYLWVEKGEEGRSPYKEFSEATTRARGRAKARIVHSLLDEKDWPLNDKDRETKIAQFAKKYGFRLRFYRKGMCAIFDKWPSPDGK